MTDILDHLREIMLPSIKGLSMGLFTYGGQAAPWPGIVSRGGGADRIPGGRINPNTYSYGKRDSAA